MKNFHNNIAYQYEAIKKEKFTTQTPDLLLGNGFSIRINPTFNDVATYPIKDILSHVKNGEINIEILSKYTDDAKEQQIQKLLQIPYHEYIQNDTLHKFSNVIEQFGNIYTTNHDYGLMYATLKHNTQNKNEPIGDYFFSSTRGQKWLYFSCETQKKYNIHLLHGGIYIFVNETGKTYKRSKSDSQNINEAIQVEIVEQGKNPFCIIEGDANAKYNKICTNDYAKFGYNKLSSNKNQKNIIIYGHSLSEVDAHIIEALKNNYNKIAVSIHQPTYNDNDAMQTEMERIRSLFKNNSDVYFFDSDTFF